ncbi:MAG: BON domain-containing protein [Desulfobacteraceae bacterium]|nr:BON domain-containing protein [Desulfobacteraceae bacterium]
MIDRDQLRKDVIDQLSWDDRVDASQVEVEAGKGGRIRLSGVVASYTAYRAAESDALSVRGVRIVDNQLEIRHPSEVAREDEEIRASLTGALGWYPDIDGGKIQVGVDAGTVTLTGAVDSFWKKLKAEELAFDTAGVTWVVNELAVVPTQSIDDEAIAREIVGALERASDILDPDRINVTVDRGLVTLSGSVSDWHGMTAAENAARFTQGVVDVFNGLVVEQRK